MRATVALLCAVLSVRAATAPLIKDIVMLKGGRLAITLENGKTEYQAVAHRPESDALGGAGTYSRFALSADRTAAGWFTEFRWPGVNYTIPQVLTVYRPGRPLQHFGPREPDYRPMFAWVFIDGAKQVAIYRDVVHGEGKPLYELFDVASGRRVAVWDGPLTPKAPAWAAFFDGQ